MAPAVVAGDDEEGCEALSAALAAGDPDLDAAWGLFAAATVEKEPLQGPASPEEAFPQLQEVASPPLVVSVAPAPAEPTERRPADGDEATHAEVASPPQVVSVRGAAPAAEPTERRPADGDEVSAAPISNVVDKAEVAAERFELPAPAEGIPTRRWDLKGCDAFVLDNVLSAEECASLVRQADGLWSFWDDAEHPRVEFRDACTIEVTHAELAARIWQRVEHLVEPRLSFTDEEDERYEVDIEGTWLPEGMNPKLLLSRYLDGGHFSPHTDGTTTVNFNSRTFYSCVLFLNASPWGGETRIYADAQIHQALVKDPAGRLTGDAANVLAAVPPAPGRMVVFYHRLMHEGVPAAEKYIIRTDVLYHRYPEQCTEPEDVEAFNMYQEAQVLAEHGKCEAAAQLMRRAFRRSPGLARVYRM